MKLTETIKLMQSKDFNNKFKAEYLQLSIRINSLKNILIKYKKGTLNFKPKCSYDLLNGQLKAMCMYKSYLEKRLKIEQINI